MSESEDLRRLSDRYKSQLHFLAQRPFANRRELRAVRAKLQATAEAERDVTTTYIAGRTNMGSVVDKNSYTNYASQVLAAYKMYDGLADYGSEVLPMVVDLRVAFIGGEGLSLYSKNKKKLKFAQALVKFNRLSGSRLIAAVRMGELEGKVLFRLKPDEEKQQIRTSLFSWRENKYKVERDKKDKEQILSIKYKPDGADKDEEISIDESVYMKLGGSSTKDDEATTKIGKCLTQCENASRAAFDLRKNTHVFGKIFPYWKTETGADAKTINDAVNAKSFEIGDGYAGAAEMRLLEPSGSAADAIIKDMLNSLRFVAAMTGVPIHWMAWPELMSNRATAENMLEVVNAATKYERLLWEEGLGTLLEKCMTLAIDAGYADNGILDDELDIRLPLVSLAALKQMMEVWTPLWESKLISTFTMRNMLPMIDPAHEAELIKKEQEEAGKNSLLNNRTADQKVAEAKNGKEARGTGTGAAGDKAELDDAE